MEHNLDSLLDMGFSKDLCEAALRETGNQSIELAMDWLLAQQGESTGQTEAEKTSLSTEDREKRMSQLQERIVLRRQERQKLEQEQELEREKIRRNQGKTLGDVRERMKEDEMRRAAEEIRREKEEKRLALERVRAEIARDKAEKSGQLAASVSANLVPVTVSGDQCRLQVRLADGTNVQKTFDRTETLAVVRLWLQNEAHITEGHTLMTAFPRKNFADDDMHKSLDLLGLVPSAVLIVARKGPAAP